MEQIKRRWRRAPTSIRKPVVAFVGGIIILGGLILIPLPGPGWAIVFVGLAVLATEFELAYRMKKNAIDRVRRTTAAAKKRLRKK